MSRYRPGPDRSRPPERRNDFPHHGLRSNNSSGRSDRGHYDARAYGADSYRPGDFSFRANGPQGRPPPRFPQPPTAPRRDLPFHDQGRNASRRPLDERIRMTGHRRNDNNVQRGNYRGPRPNRRPDTSSRPLLSTERAKTPEQLEGMNDGSSRFRPLKDLSDSGEEAMQLDSDNNGGTDGDAEQPLKRLRLDDGHQFNDSTGDESAASTVPKWSNPDPYTSLPPPEQTGEKRWDFVRLIRKAKQSLDPSLKKEDEGDDFISFDFFAPKKVPDKAPDKAPESTRFDLPKDSRPAREPANVLGAPPGPSEAIQEAIERKNAQPPSAATRDAAIDPFGPPPAPPKEVEEALEPLEVWPPPSSEQPIKGSKASKKARALAKKELKQETKKETRTSKKRKRLNDEAEDEDSQSSLHHGKSNRFKLPPVAPKWRGNLKAVPWAHVDHSDCESMAVRLHKEICDFYEYIRPLHFERVARQDLIQRLQDYVSSKWGGATVHVFGSFAADLYLPNADMDIVVLGQPNAKGARVPFGKTQDVLSKFASGLVSAGIAKWNSVATIGKARVPLVKYVDAITGIRCDVSFNNNSGPTAINTYKNWVQQYPSLPFLLPLIKHFLMMRGLNDNSTGGLGSFSLTCMLVNLMNQMPHVTSGNMNPMQNLGEVFMLFLDYYGNKFNINVTGINMSSMTLFPLAGTPFHRPHNPRLCIIDPNKSNNSLSDGSKLIQRILRSFSSAFGLLQARMGELRRRRAEKQVGPPAAEDWHGTILGPIFYGKYTQFTQQRERLREVYNDLSQDRKELCENRGIE